MYANNALLREEAATEVSGDRRARRRYPIDLAVSFDVLKNCRIVQTGTGRTVNISSRGIAFQTDKLLAPRAYVELSVSWPVLLNQTCPLKLVVTGRVVRSNGACTVVSLDHYVFRTQRLAAREQLKQCAMAAGG